MRITSALIAVLAAVALAACGDDKSKSDSEKPSTSADGAKPATLALSISESGKRATYTAPASAKGGLVEVTLENKGKKPHAAQLIRLLGGHKPAEAVKAVGGNSDKTPPWIRGEGGPSTAPPGATSKATVILPKGDYVVLDSGGPGSGPPAYKAFKVTDGGPGELPSTSTTVTADTAGKDRFKWKIDGALKPGDEAVTFVSKGKNTIHFVGLFRVKGNPSLAKIQKGLASQGKPPPFIDQSSFATTSVLDGGGKSELTTLGIRKPGQYVLFCPLTDRDGGKPHDQLGLLQKVTVK